MRDLFIVLSPLNLYIMNILVRKLKLNEISVITTKNFNEQLKNKKIKEVIIIDLPLHQENYIMKFFKILKIYFTFKNKSHYNKVFIPSDYNILVQIILKKIRINELNYYEEGGTLFYKINERSRNKIKEKLKSSLKFLLGVERTTGILTSKFIRHAYIFFPQKLKEYNPDINYVDLKDFIIKERLEIEIEKKYIECDFLILTQPLTEDKLCNDFLEVKSIEKFIEKDKKYIIKLHPRDNKEKYKKLLQLKNVLLLPEEYKNTPYQILHYNLKPKNIVSHFSSVLFSVDSIGNDFKRIALVKELNNKEIEKSILEMKNEMDDLVIK